MNQNNGKNYDMIEKMCITIIVCLYMSFCIFCFLGMVFVSRVVLVMAFIFTICVGIFFNKSGKIRLFLNVMFRLMIIMIFLSAVGSIFVDSLIDAFFRGCE